MAVSPQNTICNTFIHSHSYPIPGSPPGSPQTRHVTTYTTKTIQKPARQLAKTDFAPAHLTYQHAPGQLKTAITTVVGQILLTTQHYSYPEPITDQACSIASSGPPSDVILTEEAALLYMTYQQQDFNPKLPLVAQLAKHIKEECLAKKLKHKNFSCAQHLRALIPQGVTHYILQHLAKMLYPGTWNAGGVLLVKTLLVDYQLACFLQEEVVDQILAILEHPLEATLEQMTSIHPSMEILIHATLHLNLSISVSSIHIRQALLMSLLFSVRQYHHQPNCYAIASVCYLIGNHPSEFLMHLYHLLQQGRFELRQQHLSLDLFFPLLSNEQAWYHLNSIAPDELLCSTAVRETLHALEITARSQEGVDSTQSVMQILMHTTNLQGQSHLETPLRFYLKSYQESPIVRLFIAQQDFLNNNLLGPEYGKTHLSTLHELLARELRSLLKALPKTTSQEVLHTLQTRLVFLPLCLCPTPTQKRLLSIPYFKTHVANSRSIMCLCYLHDKTCQAFSSFSELKENLVQLVPVLIEQHAGSKPTSPIRSPQPSVDPLASFKPLKLAELAVQSFKERPQTTPPLSAETLVSLDMLVFAQRGGHEVHVLSHVSAIDFDYVMVSEAHTIQSILEELNFALYTQYRHRLSHCLLLQFSSHAFYIYLKSKTLLVQNPEFFTQRLAMILSKGYQRLTTKISKEEIESFVLLCYPFEADCNMILQRLHLPKIKTIKSLIEQLLQKVDPDDLPRIKKLIQRHYSSLPPCDLTPVCQALGIKSSPHELLSELEASTPPDQMHCYQIAYRLRKLLLAQGYYFSQQQIAEELIKHVHAQPYIEIGDLNYAKEMTENPKHQHLIAEFDYIKKEIGLFNVDKHHYQAMFWPQTGSCTFLIPKAKAAKSSHLSP